MTEEQKPTVVLLLEDDAFVRALTTELLDDFGGFKVLTASDAAKAIALLQVRADVRLVITDATIPGAMDGVGLAHVLNVRWPHVAIIVTSAVGMPSALPARAHALLKPYQAAELFDLIRVLLSTPAEPVVVVQDAAEPVTTISLVQPPLPSRE